GEEHELLRADALGVDVDDELEADVPETRKPEVGDLDRRSLGRREDDPGLRQRRRRPPLRGRYFAGGEGHLTLLLRARQLSATTVEPERWRTRLSTLLSTWAR